MIYHRLRGTRATLPGAIGGWREMPLDPSLEVFPDAGRSADRTLPSRTDNG